MITGTNIHNNRDTDIYLQWSSPRTPDTHTFFQAFGSGAVTNCLKDLGLSRLGFEHPTFRLRGERSYRLRNRCHYLFFYAYRCYIHNNDTMHEVVALSLSVFQIADLYSMEVKNWRNGTCNHQYGKFSCLSIFCTYKYKARARVNMYRQVF